jgi:hypothetical protein
MTSGALSVERLTRGDLTVVPDLIRDPRYSGLLKGSESMDPGSGAGVTSLKRYGYQGKSLMKCPVHKT